MPARQRSAAYIHRNRAPIVERLEEPMHDAALAPQYEQRTRDLPRFACRVMVEIDRGSGAVVLAARMNRLWIAEATLVFGERARIEMREAGTPAAELAVQEVNGIGADQTLGQVERLDQEEPVIVGGRECLIGVRVHRARRRDVDDRELRHGVGVIETKPMRDASAAIMADQAETRMAEIV